MTRFGLVTARRRADVTGLTWGNPDLDRKIAWLWPGEAKTAKPIAIALNDDAIALLEALGEGADLKIGAALCAPGAWLYRRVCGEGIAHSPHNFPHSA